MLGFSYAWYSYMKLKSFPKYFAPACHRRDKAVVRVPLQTKILQTFFIPNFLFIGEQKGRTILGAMTPFIFIVTCIEI